MRLIKNTTELIGIKNPNIIISLVFENGYSYRGSSKTGLSCIRNYFLKYPLKVRQKVQVYHDGHVRILYATSSKTLF